jgi:phosphatidylserine/phosphatidylglycerophosphate/cardiolipin synthase-like enzyme
LIKKDWLLWFKRCALKVSTFSLLLFAVYVSVHTEHPSEKNPLVVYSTHSKDDFHLLVCQALRSAKKSIEIHTYTLSDPTIIRLLKQKAAEGLSVTVTYDGKTTRPLPSPIQNHPWHGKGLMHRKILLIDETLVYLSSANLTEASLKMHDNVMVGLLDPHLASFLSHPSENSYQNHFFFLPDKQALPFLLEKLNQATTSIDVALFTLTHKPLITALIAAHQRGVKVRVKLDRYAFKGACKKAAAELTKAGVNLIISDGMQLYHHKWALIDQKTWIMGSANWTQAAFSKNKDFIYCIDNIKTNKLTLN